MKSPLLATLISGLLAVTGAAMSAPLPGPVDDLLGGVLGRSPADAGADEAAVRHGMAGDAHEVQLGMERPRFPPAAGSTPTAEDAKGLEQVRRIDIRGDKGFTPAAGVRSGSGTLADPYVISGYAVTGSLYLGDTDACVVVTGNYIDGELALNWNGNCVHVHHNFIRDLRVNENIPREGLDTGGLIELNQINYVGQIRHYDGEFRHNVVGPREDAKLPRGVFVDPENLLPFTKDTRVLNVDGFNQGWFHHNTITGSVDLKLHGHHHGTGFLATHSHYHGDDAARIAAMPHNHTDRWQSVRFEENKVVDPAGYGLRYTDEQHAGDDRTAASESTESLGDPHRHHTKVEIRRNTLEGAGIWVDVFNADDHLHEQRNPGWLWITDNTVQLRQRHDGLLGMQWFGLPYEANTAIAIDMVKEMRVDVRGNTLSWQATPSDDPMDSLLGSFLQDAPTPAGIRIRGAQDGDIAVVGNQGTGFAHGVAAFDMDEAVTWAVAGNGFPGAAHAVYYDESVANKPRAEPVPPLADPGAWGEGSGVEAAPEGGHHH